MLIEMGRLRRIDIQLEQVTLNINQDLQLILIAYILVLLILRKENGLMITVINMDLLLDILREKKV